jgi:protoporphyrinogen/coproporphyrinogen III oxidase
MPDTDVVVVGAGIAGLATAYRLQRRGRTVLVLERAAEVGGRMLTRREHGCVLDTGADGLLAGSSASFALIRELGLADRLRRVSVPMGGVWRAGSIHPVPNFPLGVFAFRGVSWSAKVALARLGFSLLRHHRRHRMDAPERAPSAALTVAEYARSLGPELFEHVFDPLVCGLFGADSERIGVAPLLTILLAAGGSTRTRTYRDGMDTTARQLSARVPVRVAAEVVRVEEEDGVRVVLADGSQCTAAACVLAVPAPIAAGLHAAMPADERTHVEASSYTALTILACFLDVPLMAGRCYGVTFSRTERDGLAFASFEHNKPNRVPAGRGLVRLAAAPSLSRELLEASQDDVAHVLLGSAERYFPGLRRATRATIAYRFRHALPEFTPRALESRGAFLERPPRRVDYAGDWLVAPSSEGAVRSSMLAAARVDAFLSRQGVHR